MIISSLYTGLLGVGLPVYLLRLAVKGIQNPSYRERWKERLGWTGYNQLKTQKPIWIHALSVGEVQAAQPLIGRLQDLYSDIQIVLTTTTPSGSKHARELFKNTVYHTYLPIDLPTPIKRFLKRTGPRMGIFIETEVWPNIYQICARLDIPIILANARLSSSSLKWYIKIKRLMSETLSKCLVLAQTNRDRAAFLQLGMKRKQTRIMGNLKFDTPLPTEQIQAGKTLRESMGLKRPVWIAASTHAGEDSSVLEAHARLIKRLPDLLLIMVPRHPKRFDEVSHLTERKGFKIQKHSWNEPIKSETQVYVGDTVGQMYTFYAASDLAFVGGSLVPAGGHNLMEPASVGLPIITGTSLYDFIEMANLLAQHDALMIVNDSRELTQCLLELLSNTERSRKMGVQSKRIIQMNRGAVNKVIEELRPFLTL